MPTYPLIRLAAYEPDPASTPWTERYSVLPFDEAWLTPLTDAYGRLRKGRDHPVTLPVKLLNELLRTAAPGVLAIGRGAASDPALPWLHAHAPVPTEVLTPMLRAWAARLLDPGAEKGGTGRYGSGEEGDPQPVLDAIRDSSPRWRAEEVDLTASAQSPGGTAQPDQRLYALLPARLAARLAARELRLRGTVLRFRAVSRDQGTELVSWPPLKYPARTGPAYYSALITITLHTVPFLDRPRVHVAYGIRRWVTEPPWRPGVLKGATVLLDAPLPWSAGQGRSTWLTGNSLAFAGPGGRPGWRWNSPAGLLPDVDIFRVYPEPSELIAAPGTWLTGRDGIAAAITYATGQGRHRIGDGLAPGERAELDAWVEEGLRPVLRRVPDLTRATRRTTPALRPRPSAVKDPVRRAALAAEPARDLRRALTASLGGTPLEIDVLWQSEEVRDALLARLPVLLGLPPAGATGGGREWRCDGLTIRVRARRLGAAGAPLDVPGGAPSRAVALARAVRARRAEVVRLLPPAARPALALVEIGGRPRYAEAPDTDPKHALRLGLADTGRLSQFLVIPEDAEGDAEHRAASAWADAFRQLGVVQVPRHRAGAGIPDDLQYVALWLVRTTSKGRTRCPARRLVAVRVRPLDPAHPVRGWDEVTERWVTYPELLYALARDGVPEGGAADPAVRHPGSAARHHPSDRDWRDEVERHVRLLLHDVRDRPTLLLADAGNLRQGWPGLANGALARDMLGFGGQPAQRLAAYGADLRVVLLRDGTGRDEVPEWYAHDGGGTQGLAMGVWGPVEDGDRVFASTADAPHTMKGVPRGLRKLAPLPERRTAPTVKVSNPGYLELTVLGCLSEKALADAGRGDVVPDRPVEWAALVHQLRFHDAYPTLARPLPMHLARLAGEYVLPLAVERPGR